MTYGVVEDGKLIGMFCVANDRLESEDTGRAKNKLRRLFPNSKRYHHFPSVKLARLGVTTELQKQRGIGSWIIEFLKIYFVLNNKTGCRFLTVDAYPHRTKFYADNGFTEFDPVEQMRKGDEYVYMHYDLKLTRDQFERDPAKMEFARRLIADALATDGFQYGEVGGTPDC